MNEPDLQPEYGRIPEACRRYGLSRSRLYLLAGEGEVRFIKVGTATLVDLNSMRSYLASRPPASIRPPKTCCAAASRAGTEICRDETTFIDNHRRYRHALHYASAATLRTKRAGGIWR
jgi:hypothetical protein